MKVLNPLKKIFFHERNTNLKKKSAEVNLSMPDCFSNLSLLSDPVDRSVCNAWVNISVDILIRNIARASFVLQRGGTGITDGPLYELFRRPNEGLNGYALWKETAGWWFLEGEAFWWFGPGYSGGIPESLYILDPRRMRYEEFYEQRVDSVFSGRKRRWFYQTDGTFGSFELVPILQDELVHFKNWNPQNPLRGESPMAALALELEQDYYANVANSQLLKNNAVPQGILKTDQTIRPEEADASDFSPLKGDGRVNTGQSARAGRLPYWVRGHRLRR
jgi:HK97 family phage portal protein